MREGLKTNNKQILDSFSPSTRGELEISSLNDYLAKRNQLSYKIIKEEWMDAGCSHEEYVKANLNYLKRTTENRQKDKNVS